MTARQDSDERYILDLVAQVLAEPDYRWQHRFPTLLGDPGKDGRPRPLPVDGYFPRHKLVVEFWEKQHSAPVSIMDEGLSVSGVSRGHQRRLYDQRRDAWARANGLRLVILDYRGFPTDERGRIRRDPERDRSIIAQALRAANVLAEPGRREPGPRIHASPESPACPVCAWGQGCEDGTLPHLIYRGPVALAVLSPNPAVFGHVLVAPVSHVEQATGDLTLHEYLAVQRIVYALAEAVRQALKPERVYILSLGSQQLHAHVHWHIVPCPPGLPLEEQQLALLDRARPPLELGLEEGEALVARLRSFLPSWMRTQGQ